MWTWRYQEIHTDRDLMDAMVKIVKEGDALDAAELIDDYAAFLRSIGDSDSFDSWVVAKSNMGYLCGYLDKSECEAIYALFEIEHPMLGPRPWDHSAEEIFKMGAEWAEKTIKV